MTIVSGKSMWCKLLGDPVVNPFDVDNREWTIDLVVDKDTVKKLKQDKLDWKIKSVDNVGEVIRFKRKEKSRTGKENERIEVIDSKGKPWDQKVLIGNDSEVNVKYRTWEGMKKTQNNAWIEAVQVVKLVPYNQDSSDTFPIEEELNDEIGELA